jgi:phospholipid/cholesterol/gamma-HCH transport system permease protein
MVLSQETQGLSEPPLRLEIVEKKDEFLSVRLSGRFTAKTAGAVWREIETLLHVQKPRELALDVTDLSYLDMTGVAFLRELKEIQESSKNVFRLSGMRPEYQNLLDLATRRSAPQAAPKVAAKVSFIESLGRNVAKTGEEIYEQVVFIGSTISQLCYAALHPRSVRWQDVWIFIEKGGANAAPLIIMAGFLIGVIMAFQSALPLKQMGSDVFVANVVAFAVLRELGPLITAIILAGRTGSAIAAEIGTMKINEEINALTTMGLEPVRFLVVSRMMGIVFLAPLLTILSDFFGMLGGALVFKSFGYSATTYINQITATVDLGDVLGGIFKAIPFSIAIGAIGCLRGLQTKTGASAVGESTTSSVVTGMVMIIILDGVISAIYYVLGI